MVRNLSDVLFDFGLEVILKFLRIVGIVRFAETFHKFPPVLLGNTLVLQTADIEPNLVGSGHLTRLEPEERSHEKSVVILGKLSAPKEPAVMDKFPATAYEYLADLFLSITAIGIPSPAVQLRLLEPKSSYSLFPTSSKVREH